jgi:ABC-type antimicrobial peptide transport system permease subunit
MTAGRLLARNLAYHWRGNLAVGLGVLVGTAVLTGALLVGDSLRGSLRDLTLQRLGWVDHALVGGRFVREKLADELDAEKTCPAILLQGAATKEGSDLRAGRVTILGVDERFWQPGEAPLDRDYWHPADPDDLTKSGVILNESLARELGVAVGDRISLHLQKASDVPRESLLGRRGAGDVLETLSLRVKAVLPDTKPGARFSLNTSPESPRNAFVPLSVVQSRLDQKGRANALLVGGPYGDLQQRLREHLTLDDWGLILRRPEDRALAFIHMLDPRSRDGSLSKPRWQDRIPNELAAQADKQGRLSREKVIDYYRSHHGYLSLESRQMVLDDFIAHAILNATYEEFIPAFPTLIYLADTITDGVHELTYSIVAAVGLSYRLRSEGPPHLEEEGKNAFDAQLPRAVLGLGDNEIALVDWPDLPLTAKRRDLITLIYYQLDRHGSLQKHEAKFALRAKIPLVGLADDPELTPQFRGITDKLDIRNWENPPFPYEPKRITPADEHYWMRYRTSPKAYITLKKGQELWGSRFGKYTSIRIDSRYLDDPRVFERFHKQVLANLDPSSGGLVFDAVRKRGLLASSGGTDFDGLFLGFSFFLIAAALLLVGLLFRLNMDRRAAEVGLLFATGFRRRRVGLLLLTEGTIVSALGAALGCIAVLVYAAMLLNLLRSWWPGGMDRSFLTLHVSAQSLAIGFFASLLVSVLTIAVAVWLFARVAPRVLLTGDTSGERDPAKAVKPPRWSVYIAVGFAALAILLVIAGQFVHDHEARAGTFFSSGASLLTGALAAVWAWMKRTRHGTVSGRGLPALTRLGARNGARNPLRSILTAGLLAAAAFLIVAVESFRRQTDADYLRKDSGSGGFTLLAESDVPMYSDLNSDKGREEIVELLQSRLQQQGRETGPELAKARAELTAVDFFPFRTHAGDDASCLNLYQPRRPKLLGASSRLIERGGFQFADSEPKTDEERQNPWRLLEREGDTIPVIGEANTVTWMLKNKLGGELDVQNERGETVKLRIVGLLQDSVFQSGLIMSEKNLLKLYPSLEGYTLFLIDTHDQPPADVRKLLGGALADRGFEVTPTAERLEQYLAVENTYLSTFQLLGGLGLLLGALGLAVVLLRGMWERRGELALLRALGYRHRALGWLVLAENGFLLLLGLAAGTVAALVSVAPYLIAGTGQLPLLRLLGLLLGVLLVGLVAGALAVRTTLRAPLIPALRRE